MTAAQEAGYPLIDFKGSSAADGVGWFQLNVRDGVRQSSSICYLHPLADLPENLKGR